MSEPSESLARRNLLIGGSAALAAGAFVYGAEPADAIPAPHGDGTRSTTVHADGSPIITTIASAPVSGWTYRVASMYDFFPFYAASQRTWGGNGMYTAATGGPLRASVEIPAGALVRDVEFYVYNSSATTTYGQAYLYTPGSGTIAGVGGSAAVPPGSAIQAARAVITSSYWGPYPMGSRLILDVDTPADRSVQVNGVRVGFSGGAGSTGLLGAPIRAYDSRSSGGKFAADSTRTITLPSSVIAAGVSGAVLNVTALSAASGGYLKVFSAAVSEPSASALNYRGDGSATANGMVVAVSNLGQIKIKASSAVQVIVDVTGVIA